MTKISLISGKWINIAFRQKFKTCGRTDRIARQMYLNCLGRDNDDWLNKQLCRVDKVTTFSVCIRKDLSIWSSSYHEQLKVSGRFFPVKSKYSICILLVCLYMTNFISYIYIKFTRSFNFSHWRTNNGLLFFI